MQLLPLRVKVVQGVHWRRGFSVAGALAHPKSREAGTPPEVQSAPPSASPPWQEQLPAPLSFTTTVCACSGTVGATEVTVTHFPHHAENPHDGSETRLHSQHWNFTSLHWMGLIAIWRLQIWTVIYFYRGELGKRYRNETLNELHHLIFLIPLLMLSFPSVCWHSEKQFVVVTQRCKRVNPRCSFGLSVDRQRADRRSRRKVSTSLCIFIPWEAESSWKQTMWG